MNRKNLKKIVLHVDEKGNIILLKYKDIDEKKKDSFLYGEECYKYLKKLSKNKIKDIYENPNGKHMALEYDKYVIEINDHMRLLRKKCMCPILDNIRVYEESKAIKNTRKRKVTRKNKYTKVRILAGGLSLLILSGCVLGELHKSNKIEENETDFSISDNLEDDFITTFDVKIEDNNIINLSYLQNQKQDITPTVSIKYEDRSSTSKAYTTKANYSELIDKYSKMYGLDSKLVTAIATQERGIHSGVKDVGGATGLMQVQNAIWRGERLSAYNFDTNNIETIIVNEKSLSDVHYNVKVGCMILQTVFKYMNYNTLAAVQCYNMGHGHMDTILNAYSAESGKSKEEILNDVTDTKWMDYRNLVKRGDQEYIEEVFSWLGDDIELTTKKDDGTEVNFNINILNQGKSIH